MLVLGLVLLHINHCMLLNVNAVYTYMLDMYNLVSPAAKPLLEKQGRTHK